MIRPAYRYDVIHVTGATVPAIQDPTLPAVDPDPCAGITEYSFTDADGHSMTSIFFLIGAKDNDALIRFSRDGTTWGPAITVYCDDNPIVRYLKAQRIQVMNAAGGADADLQVEIYG